jgi:CheY-like chemotaxis protein
MTRPLLLVVEDVELNRDLLGQILDEDFDLAFACDGAEGLARAAELRPALILMDLSLPVMDGWEAIRRLKANPALAAIPVIALTAHAMAGEADKAHAAGADDFLTKPIDEDLLWARLSRWLR